MLRIVTGLLLILGSQSYGSEYPYPVMPNPQVSPGHRCTVNDPSFRGYRYSWKLPVCNRSVSHELKVMVYKTYNIPEKCWNNYTIDHIIPLSIGGSNKYENLWPEHKAVKNTRIDLETNVHIAVELRKMSPEDAIKLVLRTKFDPNIRPRRGSGNCN